MSNVKFKSITLSLLLAASFNVYAQDTPSGAGSGGASGEDAPVEVPEKKKPKSICYSEVKDKVNNFLNNLIPNTCANINTNPDPSSSKFAYENPDGGCDIGLDMPGLPSFGGSITGFDACQIVKAVTGDMVDKVNDTVNDAWDGAINAAKGKIMEQTGLDVDNLNFNMNNIAIDAINGDDATRSFRK